MGRFDTALADLHDTAARQHGVVTTDEVRTAGLTPAAMRAAIIRGSFRRVHRGVFVANGAPRTWRQRVMIAVRIGGGAASHRCSARLHRCDGFSDAPIEILVDRNGPRQIDGVVVHRTASLDPSQVTLVDGIPTMSFARTVLDLGAVADDDTVEKALDDFLRRGYRMQWLAETIAMATRPGVTGIAALHRVMARPDRRGPLPDSTFERLLERVVDAEGIPSPQRQVVVSDGDEVIARIDVAWPERRLGLEADSELWHWGPRRGRVARVRHNRLTAAGWTMLYGSWQDVADPAGLIDQLRGSLQHR